MSQSTQSIEQVLMRGVAAVYPNEMALRERLVSGEPLRVYAGIDPTAPSLHVGHLSLLTKLRDFQSCGHHVIVLIGDYTGTIGDPTGKLGARQALSREEVLKNTSNYREQIMSVLDERHTELRHNSEWYEAMRIPELLGLATEHTVGQFIERDMFQERMRVGNPIFLHEFLYPLLQGYDSVALNADVEVGGNDQIFNMLVGREMQKRRGREKYVLATKLITDGAGKKMGKTEGGVVFLNQEPEQLFGAIMSISDVLVPTLYELCTREDLEAVSKRTSNNPFMLKQELAEHLVSLFYGTEHAARARDQFTAVFSEGSEPLDAPRVELSTHATLAEALLAHHIITSKSEWRRLITQGAVTVAGVSIHDVSWTPEDECIIRIGKHRFARLIPPIGT